MRFLRLDIHRVLQILETAGTMSCTWPLNPETGGIKLFLQNLYAYTMVLNLVFLIMPIGLCAYYFRHDSILLMKCLSQINVCIETILDILLNKYNNVRLQKLVTRMKTFVKTANPSEIEILQKYIDRYSAMCQIIASSFVFCAIAFILSPIFLHTNFPGDTVYPFSTDAVLVRGILYSMQIIAVYVIVGCLCVDITIATFLWYSAARTEMLISELQNVREEHQLKSCIRKHQEIIQFVRDTEDAVGHLVFKSNVTMSVTVICGTVPLLLKQPLTVTSQFLTIVIASLQRLFIISWPADDLKEISKELAISVYSIPWIGKSKSMLSNVGFVILRSQEALVLSITLLPPPSFEYYASFLKTISSYFMGIRTMIGV